MEIAWRSKSENQNKRWQWRHLKAQREKQVLWSLFHIDKNSVSWWRCKEGESGNVVKKQSKGRAAFVPCQHRAVEAENGAVDNKQESGTWTISCPDTQKHEKSKIPLLHCFGEDKTQEWFNQTPVPLMDLLSSPNSWETQAALTHSGSSEGRAGCWGDWKHPDPRGTDFPWHGHTSKSRHQNYILFVPKLEFLEWEWA